MGYAFWSICQTLTLTYKWQVTGINHFIIGLNSFGLTIVVAGVGVLFSRHVVGVDFAHGTEQIDQLGSLSVS